MKSPYLRHIYIYIYTYIYVFCLARLSYTRTVFCTRTFTRTVFWYTRTVFCLAIYLYGFFAEPCSPCFSLLFFVFIIVNYFSLFFNIFHCLLYFRNCSKSMSKLVKSTFLNPHPKQIRKLQTSQSCKAVPKELTCFLGKP